MKYRYVYKTSDGVRHQERMEAPSREAVFSILRERGIRAIKVEAEDGSKANGEIRVSGVRRRVAVALMAAVGIMAGLSGWLLSSRSVSENAVSVKSDAEERTCPAKPLPRQEIRGNRERLADAATNLFATAAEAYLSQFAEPGRAFGGEAPAELVADGPRLLQILGAPVLIRENAFTEWVDLARMTEWIKREMREYLRGGGKADEYLRLLHDRQRSEIDAREKAERRLRQLLVDKGTNQAAIYDYWLKANACLQAMGISPLPMPSELRNFQQPLDMDD